MGKKIKQFIVLAIVCGIIYGLFSYHIIIVTGDEKAIRALEKSTMTLSDTFISLETGSYSGLDKVLGRGTLREDGLGELLVEMGVITDQELRKLEEKIDSGN